MCDVWLVWFNFTAIPDKHLKSKIAVTVVVERNVEIPEFI